MVISKPLEFLIVIFGVFVAYRMFHDYTFTRNQRFGIALGLLADLFCSLALTVPESKTVQFYLTWVFFFIILSIMSVIVKHFFSQRRDSRLFNRFSTPIFFTVCLGFQKKGMVDFGHENLEKIKEFLDELPAEHREIASRLAFTMVHEVSKKKLRGLADSVKYLDVDAKIKAYWKTYND